MSPRKKKIKLEHLSNLNPLKREEVLKTNNNFKRPKVEKQALEDGNKQEVNNAGVNMKTEIKMEVPEEQDIQAKKRVNFVKACEKVSRDAYFDHKTKLQLLYLPPCSNQIMCKHQESYSYKVMQVPNYVDTSMTFEMKTNMWMEALELCEMSVREHQYLSAGVMKDIIEIMLNAHEDMDEKFTTAYLIDRCQQILALNFSFHPPCMTKTMKKLYKDLLFTPLDTRENTFTNRGEFECEKGIVKYCINRLQHEMSTQSKDGPLVDRYINTPEEMKETLIGMHWQKEKFEIFELLDRPQRIERLMAVLESIIELLQFDLVIWHSRYTSNLGCHIMRRSKKPLMAIALWSSNVLYTGMVNNNCRQFIRIFIQMIHLQYPEKHIRIMTAWINTIIHTFYVCESNSNNDYPHTGAYCANFSRELYKILTEMPNDTIIRVLERIKPSFMQHLLGTLHLKTQLKTKEDDILKIFIDFVKKTKWKMFPESSDKINIRSSYNPKLNVFKYLVSICDKALETSKNSRKILYPKFDSDSCLWESETDLNHVLHILFIAVEAYLNAYNIPLFLETLSEMNEQLENGQTCTGDISNEHSSYSVSELFVKKYRSIVQLLPQLAELLTNMDKNNELPTNMKIFKKLGLFEL